jgi:hypothetical protein
MSDMFDKIKDAASGAVDKVKDLVDKDKDGDITDDAKGFVDQAKDSDALRKVEDHVEAQAEKGGALGGIADKADDAIDKVQGTKD